MSAEHHAVHQQLTHHHHDYRSSDDEVEEVVPTHKKRQAVSGARCLIVSSKSASPLEEDSLDDSDEDEDDRRLHRAAHPHSIHQQRSSILNHTSHPHVQQHNHHPHILSNHSSSSSSSSHNNSHPTASPSQTASSGPVVNHAAHSMAVSHVITEPWSSHRSSTDTMYLPKGENGHQLAYRVVQMAELQQQQQQVQSVQQQQQQQQLNSSSPHHQSHVHHSDGHQATILGLTGTPAAAIITAAASSSSHFHAHASTPGNGDSGDSGGPAGYYVMMTPTGSTGDQLQIHGTPAPRKKSNSINVADLSCASSSRNTRDERRRATHNEVERRRRDKINNWITKLAKLVPDCNQDHTKQGQSKGGILAKTCDHICDLEQRVSHYKEMAKDREILASEVLALRDQLNSASSEIRRLRSLLAKQGVQEDLN